MSNALPTIEDTRQFWPAPNAWDGINVVTLLTEIKQFALLTFDMLDLDGNGFISAAELQLAIKLPHLNLREKNYVRFLLGNIEAIGRAFDDHDDISPCGISRGDIQGISRPDLIQYFARM